MADGRHPFGVRRTALATVNDDLPSGAKPGRIGAFDESGGAGKPRHGELWVCCAETREQAIETVMRQWPLPGLPPGILTDLATPPSSARPRSLLPRIHSRAVSCLGSEPAKHIQAIERYAQGGFDHVHIHQIGQDQESALRLYEREILPQVERITVSARA